MKKTEPNWSAVRASFHRYFAVFTQTLSLVVDLQGSTQGVLCVDSPITAFLLLTATDSTISQRAAVGPAAQQCRG